MILFFLRIKKKSFEYADSWSKNLLFRTHHLKFHNRTDIITQIGLNRCICQNMHHTQILQTVYEGQLKEKFNSIHCDIWRKTWFLQPATLLCHGIDQEYTHNIVTQERTEYPYLCTDEEVPLFLKTHNNSTT